MQMCHVSAAAVLRLRSCPQKRVDRRREAAFCEFGAPVADQNRNAPLGVLQSLAEGVFAAKPVKDPVDDLYDPGGEQARFNYYRRLNTTVTKHDRSGGGI